MQLNCKKICNFILKQLFKKLLPPLQHYSTSVSYTGGVHILSYISKRISEVNLSAKHHNHFQPILHMCQVFFMVRKQSTNGNVDDDDDDDDGDDASTEFMMIAPMIMMMRMMSDSPLCW